MESIVDPTSSLAEQYPDISQIEILQQETTQPQDTHDASRIRRLTPSTTAAHNQEEQKMKGSNYWSKSKKRKRTRDMNAPIQPLTGYIRFLNDRREKVRQENPSMSFADISKHMAQEWANISQQEKQKYLDEASKDKERYNKEMEQYQQTEAYKMFVKQQQDRRQKEENRAEVLHDDREDSMAGFDIPIFTEEFLDHNRSRETELRQLRKSITDYEEQNAILSKHIENMKSAIDKLQVEALQQRNNNMALQQHLDSLRMTLTQSFAAVPLPGNEVPTLETIDNYMAKLHTIILDNPQENEQLIATVREIVGRLEYPQ